MNIALIFAGGKGTRMSSADKPKQFLEINGKPIICYTVEHFQNSNEIDQIIVISIADWLDYMKKILAPYSKVKHVIEGGKTALESQYLGLRQAIKQVDEHDKNIVLVHDGVRPIINEKLIEECIKCVKTRGNAITVAPAIETIVTTDENGEIIDIINRERCKLARAPQAFFLEELFNMHEQAKIDGKYDFIDSASMMQHYGKKLHLVDGPADNIKVTTDKDYYICKGLLSK